MTLKKYLFIIATLLLFLSMNPEKSQAATVYWDGIELKKGQIGRVTIIKPINLWKRTENGLQFERLLQEGERFRVYRMDDQYGGQYGVGGDYYITKMSDYTFYETPSSLKRKLLDCNQACLVDMIIQLPLEKYDIQAVNQMKERLMTLPEALLVDLISHDIHIILVNGPITDTKEYSHLKGAVPRGWENTNKTWDDVPGVGGSKTIVVRIGFSEKGNGHGSINLELHELAHSIDEILENKISATPAFQSVWNAEKRKLFPLEEYFHHYSEEYFAEVFALFYRDKASSDKLKKSAPLTYQFIENIK